MTSIERTAYPRFKRNPTVRELLEVYTPSQEEIEFARATTRGEGALLSLVVMLKGFQRLGYFPRPDAVPVSTRRLLDISRHDHGGGLLTRWDAQAGRHVFLTEAELEARRDAWWERSGKRWVGASGHPLEAPPEPRVDAVEAEIVLLEDRYREACLDGWLAEAERLLDRLVELLHVLSRRTGGS